jgi:hypothetical protein
MPRTDALAAEMHRIREILESVSNPYDRYQLTLLLETAARSFVTNDAATAPNKTRKGRRQCKANNNTLLN